MTRFGSLEEGANYNSFHVGKHYLFHVDQTNESLIRSRLDLRIDLRRLVVPFLKVCRVASHSCLIRQAAAEVQCNLNHKTCLGAKSQNIRSLKV